MAARAPIGDQAARCSRITLLPWLMAAWVAATLSGPLLPSLAAACSCPVQAGNAMWPLPGASEVPVDTPLVVARYNLAGSTESIGFQLVDSAGADVPLIEVNRLAAAYQGCGAVETLFLRPAKSLDPHAQYTLALSDEVDPERAFGATFTTSDVSFAAEPSPLPTLDYLLVTQPGCTDASCLKLAEARVGIEAATGEPHWLVMESAALEHGHNAHVFGAQDETAVETQLSVVVPDDHCIDARLYGLEGTVLWEEHRCAPDRCAHTDATTLNSCGGPPFSGLRAADVPRRSCDAPPTIHQPGPDQDPSDEGCQVASRSSGSLPSVLWALASLLAIRASRRSRRPLIRQQSPPGIFTARQTPENSET